MELKQYLIKRIEMVDKALDDMVDKNIGMINVSLLTKKEKAEVVNKRNCLLVQKHCYEEILQIFTEDKEYENINKR